MQDTRSAIAFQLGSLMVANAEAAAEVMARDKRISELEAQLAELQAEITALKACVAG